MSNLLVESFERNEYEHAAGHYALTLHRTLLRKLLDQIIVIKLAHQLCCTQTYARLSGSSQCGYFWSAICNSVSVLRYVHEELERVQGVQNDLELDRPFCCNALLK